MTGEAESPGVAGPVHSDDGTAGQAAATATVATREAVSEPTDGTDDEAATDTMDRATDELEGAADTSGPDAPPPGDGAGDGGGPDVGGDGVDPVDPVDSVDPSGTEEPADAEAGPAPDGRRRGGVYRMAIVSTVSMDLPNPHPTVVLRETESPRRQLSFSVGLPDGIGLSHALRRIATPRPLTHELFGEVLAGFDIDVVAVRLVGRQGATYFAELDLRGRNGRSVHSCRPTDALAVALRQKVPVPILIDERLFESVGDVEPAGTVV